MTEKEELCTTVALYWQLLMPDFAVPSERFIRGWLNLTQCNLEKVLEVIERVAARNRKGMIESAEHASKSVTVRLKYPFEQDDQVRTLHN